MPDYEVVSVDPATEPGWDEFVRSRPGASVYHLSAWSTILARSYRYEAAHRVLRDTDGRIRGVLPLLAKNGRISGRRLRSLPVVPTGGPLSESPEGALILVEHACRLAAERQSALVIESRLPNLEDAEPGLDAYERPPSWVLDLPNENDEAEWLAARNRNTRRELKKAEASGLGFREGERESDLRGFYRIYMANMRVHRSLPRLYRQLKLARAALSAEEVFRLFLVEDHGRVVAGGVFHAFGDTVEALYGASDHRYLAKRPNYLLYRRVMNWAREHGFSKLDFGYAWPGSSLAGFKSRWGAEPVPEYGYSYVARSRTRATKPPAPHTSGSASDNSGEGFVSRAWGRAPLALTRAAATVAYRYL